MSRAIIPIANISRRLPEAGRIRTGVKSGNAMKALREFRFTSHDETALQQVADMYGGTVKPWSDPKAAPGQYELITTAKELRVILPPDPLGGTPIYEQWSGGGCERRCDGVTCTITVQGPDGLEPTEVPCRCDAEGSMSCDVKVRLNVLLPEVRFVGTWRLESKSWNAAQELPGMVDMIQSLQGQGLSYASLTLQPRKSVRGGKTRNFVIPVLGIPASLEQLAAGASRLQSLGTGGGPSNPSPALGAGESSGEEPVGDAEPTADEGPPPRDPSPSPDAPDPDDEIVDAEIVDEPETPTAPPPTGDACSRCSKPWSEGELVKGGAGESRFVHRACANAGEPMAEGQQKFIFAELRKRSITGPQRFEWATGLLGRDVSTFKELTKADAEVLIADLKKES